MENGQCPASSNLLNYKYSRTDMGGTKNSNEQRMYQVARTVQDDLSLRV
jgi:hypothetical protein